MGQRKVYIDFVDGNGYVDVSDFVKYNTLTIQETAFNDTYHAAQNTCSFNLIYDASIYNKVVSSTINCPIRIFDLRESAALHTEADQPILTESGIRLLIETSVAVPIFAGHIPPKTSREYNGILDNTFIKISATDDLDLFDKEVGDVLYANCAVMNPADPTNSIVHKLALLAGWTSSMVSSVSIPTVIPRFSPPDAKATIRSVLDTLLFEYGYTLSLDEANNVSPIQWNVSLPATVPEFNENNIIDEISIEHTINKYDGVKVIYYDMNSANHIRLYRDSNCGYADDGTFAGYAILNNTDYPPEANAIDETTGNKQVVYQEYTDNAIKYATNKAIQQNLDYNYKNYSSDFTAIISTENHYVDRRFETGVTVITESFGNKKCQLLYRNTSGASKLLYFNDVYGTVWYKSAERTAIKNLITTPTEVYTYTSTYVYSKVIGDALALAIAAQYKNGCKQYTIISENDYTRGGVVHIVLSGEGTDTYALIQNKQWDESKELYTYTCLSYNPTRESLTSQTVSATANINISESYNSIHTIGTPEAVSDTITTEVAAAVGPTVIALTPKYLGMYLDSAPGTFNEGDWYTRYSATSGTSNRGVFVRGTSSWSRTEDSRYIGNGAINDILKITANPVVMTSASSPSGTWVNQLGLYGTQMYVWNGTVWNTSTTISYGVVSDYGATYYENLFSRFIKILTGGSIYGGDRFDSAGTEIDVTKNGFYLGADGALKANLQSLFKSNVIVGTDAGKHIQNTGSTSNFNTIIGTKACQGVAGSTTSYFTTAIGYEAGFSLTNGYYNTLVGAYAGLFLTSGYLNTLVGEQAGALMDVGLWNVVLGATAGSYLHGPANNNTIIGNAAGIYLAGGSNNVYIGGSSAAYKLYDPSSTTIVSSECINIGSNARIYAEAGEHQINLGNRMLYMEFDSTTTRKRVYDCIAAYVSVEEGTHEVATMGRWGTSHCSYIQIVMGALISFYTSAGTSLLTVYEVDDVTTIGQDLQICFIPPYYVLP